MYKKQIKILKQIFTTILTQIYSVIISDSYHATI